MIDRRLMDVYACPACSGTLEWTETEATCTGCATRYPVRGNQVDLHLQSPKKVEVSPVVRPFGDDDPSYLRRPTPIPMNPQGRIDCDPHEPEGNLWFGNGLTRELASWFPTGTEDAVVMDLGCGTRRVEPVLRMTGMTYLGTDVFGPEPDALCIAEALPLVDQSIDFIFALAVLPHVKRPWVAVHEIARVLKPGGTFIGTSQFLEPCDMQSRHHASALGVLDWLEEGGFEVVQFEANDSWSGARAMAMMGYFPPKFGLSKGVGAVVDGAHGAYGRVRSAVKGAEPDAPLGEGLPERYTGGFRFVVQRPA